MGGSGEKKLEESESYSVNGSGGSGATKVMAGPPSYESTVAKKNESSVSSVTSKSGSASSSSEGESTSAAYSEHDGAKSKGRNDRPASPATKAWYSGPPPSPLATPAVYPSNGGPRPISISCCGRTTGTVSDEESSMALKDGSTRSGRRHRSAACQTCCIFTGILSVCCCGCLVIAAIVALVIYMQCRASLFTTSYEGSVNGTVTDLSISLDSGSITVRVGATDVITYTVEASINEDHKSDLEAAFGSGLAAVDGLLSIQYDGNPSDRAHASISDLCFDNVDLVLTLPSNSSLNSIVITSKNSHVDVSDLVGSTVTISTTNGGIDVNGITATGDVEITTSNGGVEVNDVTTLAAVKVDSTNGGIQVKDLSGSSLEVGSSNGGLHITNVVVTSSITITTTNGGIELAELTAETFSVETSNGGINADLVLSAVTSCEATFKSTNGGISLENIEVASPRGVGVSCDVTVHTSNGQVSLDLVGFSGTLETSTNDGSVDTSGNISGSIINGGSLGDTVTVQTSNGHINVYAQ